MSENTFENIFIKDFFSRLLAISLMLNGWINYGDARYPNDILDTKVIGEHTVDDIIWQMHKVVCKREQFRPRDYILKNRDIALNEIVHDSLELYQYGYDGMQNLWRMKIYPDFEFEDLVRELYNKLHSMVKWDYKKEMG